MKFMTVLWQDYILFKARFWSNTLGTMIAPVLYLVAFGWGLGSNMSVEGVSYINFVIPGIIALTTMTISFSTVANDINISRIYTKTFEEFMISPIDMRIYSLAKITSGALRGIYSAAIVILLAFVFQSGLSITPYFISVMVLNCFVFSAFGFAAGLLVDSHADMSKLTNFVITPMAFLCGTFFPLDRMPLFLKGFILALPLTHTSLALRGASELWTPLLVLMAYFVVFLIIGIKVCEKAE